MSWGGGGGKNYDRDYGDDNDEDDIGKKTTIMLYNQGNCVRTENFI